MINDAIKIVSLLSSAQFGAFVAKLHDPQGKPVPNRAVFLPGAVRGIVGKGGFVRQRDARDSDFAALTEASGPDAGAPTA